MNVPIPLEILEAYAATQYRVFADPCHFTLRVGERSDALAALHSIHGVSCSAFVTPCNPLGVRWSEAACEEAMLKLCSGLEGQGIRWIRGEGAGVGGDWPAEPSVLALGVSAKDARAMCSALAQNAVVWCPVEATPVLLLHPSAALTLERGHA